MLMQLRTVHLPLLVLSMVDDYYDITLLSQTNAGLFNCSIRFNIALSALFDGVNRIFAGDTH